MLFYGKHNIDQSDNEAVLKALNSGFLTNGPELQAFENNFAKYVGCKHAIAVANGTAALHLAALVKAESDNIKEKKKTVITTPLTFVATAAAFMHVGYDIEFVDIDPTTNNIDLNLLEEKINKSPDKYAGIVPVHFAGLTVDMEALYLISNKYNLWVIEDAAHALGAEQYFEKTKSWHKCGDCYYSDMTTFSFHPVKHITSGEGGMITTNDNDIAQKLKLLRSHCMDRTNSEYAWQYDIPFIGFNYRLSEIQCALANSQLSRLDSFISKRIDLANKYNTALKNTELKVIMPGNKFKHAYHLYVIRTPHRNSLFDVLKQKNIIGQVHYTPVHLFSHFQKNGFKDVKLIHSEQYYEECLSLPLYPDLSHNEQESVIGALIQCLDEHYPSAA